MESKNLEKWTSFENPNDKGPFIVLIKDIEWWDSNRPSIHDWFDRNCPAAKPETNDTMIWFQNKGQYLMWRMTWDR